jgi:adenosylhomocysteine nucleosidase
MIRARVAELVEQAFDYRGYVTVRRSDGSELVGFVYHRDASHLEIFDETASHRVRIDLAEVVDIAFTGDDAARKSQEIWERRKGTLEPRDTPAWGTWQDAAPALVLVALEIELRSVARALGGRPRGNRVLGKLGGTDAVALAIGLGGGALRAVEEERPRLVLSCGFSAGLDETARPGDVVLASSVRDEMGDVIVPPAPLREAAARTLEGMPLRQGELVCSTSVAASPEGKRALARPGALALDMESYPVARAAAARGVPWLALRTIVDPLSAALPPFAREARQGYAWPALKHALKGPGAAVELIRLGIWARRAGEALEEALRRLSPVLRPSEARR